MRYSRWVSSVLVAAVQACPQRYLMCTVAAVVTALGMSVDTNDSSEFTTVGRPGSALRSALDELSDLGLLTWSLSNGIRLEGAGRDAAEAGLETLWPHFLSSHLNSRATQFLARLVMLSLRDRDTFVDIEVVDTFEVASSIGWPISEYDHQQSVHAAAQDLIDKDFARRVLVDEPGIFGIRPTYRGIVRASEVSDRAGARSGVIDWSTPLGGWDDIEDRMRDLKLRLDSASTVEDFKDVGRRSRDLVNDTVNRVFRPADSSGDREAPKTAETKVRFEQYLERRLGDDSYFELVAYMKKTLDLANATTHGTSTDRLRACGSTQAAIGLVRIVQAIERDHERA